jgi:flavin-dependent thymidylate synthase
MDGTPGTDISRWADPAMFEAEPMPSCDPKVILISATPDPLGAIAAACKMYKGEVCRGLDEITDEEREHFFKEVQKTHLTAPLEFVDLHFMIEGVTRAFTHQLVRQRTAVYVQESLRFAVKEGFAAETPLPPSLVDAAEDDAALVLWRETIGTLETRYERLINMGIPAEDARGILPHQLTTRVHYKTNLRNLAEHAGNRLCTQAQFEWREVFAEIVKAIRYYCPPVAVDRVTGLAEGSSQAWMFERIATSDLFRPVCYAKGKCPFNAEFDRGCTIRPRVEEGKFDEIDPREWMFDPTAARRK